MTKTRLIFPICFTLVTGCAFLNDTEVAENKESAPSVVENHELPPGAETPAVETAPTVIVKKLSADDIRRIQARLRDVGLDPGPVDGVAGARTKTAFDRFRAGCEEVQRLLADEKSSPPGGGPAKLVNREETLALQTQLRHAGFNPGPVDGIFGGRTRAVVDQLRKGCATITDYAALSEQPASATNKNIATGQIAEPAIAPIGMLPSASSRRTEPVKAIAVTNGVPSREDVRIIQLRLRDAGYDPGPFDGVMGPKTKLALQQLQASQKSGRSKTSLTAGISTQY